ncbi:hypothetical protein DFH27DRAFT_552944 [Peziza echinospora]|nr:hypothetical protein DFH27DRAFT_552944 [Peziza echinospora]
MANAIYLSSEVDDDGSPDINKPAGENVPAAEIQEQRSPQNSPVEVRTDRPKHEESNNEKHEDGNIYECCKEVDNDGKDQWPRCEEGRKRRLDKSMHKPDTIRRRTASINCTRIRYHKDNFDSSKKRLKCSECRSAKGVAKHHDKPREVLTPHGLFYLACLTNYYEGEKHETTLHLDGKKRAWYKRFFTWVASLFRSRSDATEPAEYEQHIPEENRIPKDQALQLYDQFNDMNADVLADLSKSDALAKIVLVTQGGWMIIQVVSRAFANQPIVALELHAAARIAIGVAQYMYWWYKPVSILVMTPINLPKKNYNEMMETKTWDVTNGLSVEKVYRDFMRVGMTTSGFLRKLKDEKEDGKKERMGVRQDKDNTEKIPPHTHRFSIVRWWSELTHLNEDEGMNNYYTTSESTLGKYTYKNMMKPAKPYEVIRCATSMILHLVFSWHDYPLFAIFWYICAVSYGAIHLCAWNWYFPTEWERMTWNICTLVTTLGMACLVYLSFLWSFWLFVMRRLSRAAAKQGASTGEEPWWVKIRGIFKIITLWASFLGWCGRQGIRIVGVAITIGVIPWVWARAFMLFEAYFSIREVEKGSYDVLHWVDVLPHLG